MIDKKEIDYVGETIACFNDFNFAVSKQLGATLF
jgi:hypothetical protein